jgi:S-adenosylmethionine-diacylglycerol 3-amino-3-carboxypropyl transferase
MTAPEPSTDITGLWAAGRLGRSGKGPPEVVFAQVREDAAVEVAALATCPMGETAFCIGSGGCTAFSLLSCGPSRLAVVDINPAQVALLELKKAALERLSYPNLLRCLNSDARPCYAGLRPLLTPEASAFWDHRQPLLAAGLNQCGIVEQKLRRVMGLFLPLLLGRRRLETMFRITDLAAQRAFYRRHWDNWRWRTLFRLALSRPLLRLVYGKPFVEQVPHGFARLIKARVDAAFTETPITQNGYLWQTFLGSYPPGDAGLPIYLRSKHHSTVRAGLPNVILAHGDAAGWLEGQPTASIGFFALSNILEVTQRDYATRLAAAVVATAKPGAVICLRSIFPPGPADLLRRHPRFVADEALSAELAQIDRSLFCKFIQILRLREWGCQAVVRW